MVSRFFLWTASAALVSGVSDACTKAWEAMEKDDNYQYWLGHSERHCYVALQNEVTKCCSQADYRDERFTCRDCTAECRHSRLENFCAKFYGQGCVADYAVSVRHPVAMQGSVCIPRECQDEATDALRAFYPGLGLAVSVACPVDSLARAALGVGIAALLLLFAYGVLLALRPPASVRKQEKKDA